jgi:hypothetical protein
MSDPIKSADTCGTGYVRFIGGLGTEATLSTRQLDLYGAINPSLDFWYYHDSTVSENDYSYTDVYVMVDGGLAKGGKDDLVLSLYKKGTPHGWKQYHVDLRNYIWDQCVYIEFRSMNKSSIGQYIDWIVISSDQDLAVREIYVTPDPTADACGIKNTDKDVYVVLQARTAQAIDFSKEPTNIRTQIWTGTTLVSTMDYPLTMGRIDGNSLDTFKVTTNKINFTKGTHQIKAFLTVSVDGNPANDRDSIMVSINPALKVTVQKLSAPGSCLSKEMYLQQDIVVENTGDMALSGIKVRMIIDSDVPQIVDSTLNIVLRPGEKYIVKPPYTVPAQEKYYVVATAHLICDSALVNARHEVDECVDIDDIKLLEFIKPVAGEDTKGEEKEISVRLTNLSEDKDYNGVIIRAWIEDMSGNLQQSEIPEVLPKLEPGDNIVYTFVSKYKVPELSDYIIRVFIDDKWDNYQVNYDGTANDTLWQHRRTGNSIISNMSDKFVLGQNIPNPAKQNTMIEYSVPASGEVLFIIQSVSGQILHSQTLQSEQGKHFIELNTSDFAAGVYFYSMEYRGQKFVKRMVIKK